ncbi:probable beta-D-xylosidase 7 [Rosa chinensis]|nr:probable beta-D-xylosidase 7 [Rosa chinensis]
MKLRALILIPLIFFSTLIFLIDLTESTQPPYSCDSSNPSTESYPFCKTTLPIHERVHDLVSRLTLDEKISQLVNSAPPIPRLGIPSYEWWSEALHGVADVGKGVRLYGTVSSATSFPQVILTAASFNEHLWYRIGQAIGTEARAVYNAGQATGMTFWAPNINIFRDPRWGRGQETPGEDPMMTGKYAVAYVRGVQGDSYEGGKLAGHLKASACCKHFTAYDLDSWNNVTRFGFNAKVTQQDLADTYQPPFKSCVEQGKASGIMCAYNQVNGVPSCADHNLLTKTARGQWDFHGYITSDCDAVGIIHDVQGYAKQPEDAVVDVLKAGMDVNCGTYLQNYTKSAVQQKKLPITFIDKALHNLFSIRMRLGLFDGNPTKLLFGNIGPDQVCSKQHQVLALEAAEDGIVLLKNADKLLPLPKSKGISLAVIGPNANASETLLGNYHGPPCKVITPLEGLLGYAKKTVYHPGCDTVKCPNPTIDQAVKVAEQADYVVLIVGLDQSEEREAHDRDHLYLPGKQQQLISSVAKAAKKPVILVILSGGPVDISAAKDNPKIGSILWAGYPGEAGGIALAEIIFGDHNPGGRLPVTWYTQDYIKTPMTDMRMRHDKKSGYPGRTYRFYTGERVFDFGYGLSYSNYPYNFVSSLTQKKLYLNESSVGLPAKNSDSRRYRLVSDLGEEFCQKNLFKVTVRAKNDGEMAGKHPVLLFVSQKNPSNGSPIKQLVGFKSVILSAGEKAEFEFMLNPCEHFSHANEDGSMVVEEGSRFLVVGDVEHPIHVIV